MTTGETNQIEIDQQTSKGEGIVNVRRILKSLAGAGNAENRVANLREMGVMVPADAQRAQIEAQYGSEPLNPGLTADQADRADYLRATPQRIQDVS